MDAQEAFETWWGSSGLIHYSLLMENPDKFKEAIGNVWSIAWTEATRRERELVAAMMCCLSDFDHLEDADAAKAAVAQWQRYVATLNQEPWANGKHSGDCTNQAHPCGRCLVEKYRGLTTALGEEAKG